jgi:hypothetical protein
MLPCTMTVRDRAVLLAACLQVIDSSKLARIVLCSMQPGDVDPDHASHWEEPT